MDHDSAIELMGAYALDACDEEEAAAIDAHLLGCDVCQGEMAEIQRAAGWLGVSESATPPSWLRAEILRQAEKEALSPAERRGLVADRRAGGTKPRSAED